MFPRIKRPTCVLTIGLFLALGACDSPLDRDLAADILTDAPFRIERVTVSVATLDAGTRASLGKCFSKISAAAMRMAGGNAKLREEVNRRVQSRIPGARSDPGSGDFVWLYAAADAAYFAVSKPDSLGESFGRQFFLWYVGVLRQHGFEIALLMEQPQMRSVQKQVFSTQVAQNC